MAAGEAMAAARLSIRAAAGAVVHPADSVAFPEEAVVSAAAEHREDGSRYQLIKKGWFPVILND